MILAKNILRNMIDTKHHVMSDKYLFGKNNRATCYTIYLNKKNNQIQRFIFKSMDRQSNANNNRQY